MAPPFDYYAELGVDQSVTVAELTSAWRKLSLQHHPDKNTNDEAAATVKTQRINEAYEAVKCELTARQSQATSAESNNDFTYENLFRPRHDDHGFANTSAFFSAWYQTLAEEKREQARQQQARRERERQECQAREAREARERSKAKKQAEKQASQEEELLRRNAERTKEKSIQEERWAEAGAVTKDEKLRACLHSGFCAKFKLPKKFICSACRRKGGILAFECPYCSSFLCPQCLNLFSQRRARLAHVESGNESTNSGPEDGNFKMKSSSESFMVHDEELEHGAGSTGAGAHRNTAAKPESEAYAERRDEPVESEGLKATTQSTGTLRNDTEPAHRETASGMYANLFEKNVQNNGINRHDARMSSEAKEQNKYKSKSKTTGAASQPTMATGTSTPDTNRVCIKMIARSTTREQLKDSLQASFGTVTDVQMFRPKLGIAWAEFALRESCEKALASRAVMVASSLVKIVKWRG